MLLTPRLELAPITLPVVEAILAEDRARAEQSAGAAFPAHWPCRSLLEQSFYLSIDDVRADPHTRLWGDHLMILREGKRRVVGSVIFNGRPGFDGVAELGYGVEENAQRRGLASEATQACVAWALEQDGVQAIRATTFPWHRASLKVISRLGMVPVETREHDVLGEMIVFEVRRSAAIANAA